MVFVFSDVIGCDGVLTTVLLEESAVTTGAVSQVLSASVGCNCSNGQRLHPRRCTYNWRNSHCGQYLCLCASKNWMHDCRRYVFDCYVA